MRRKTMLDKKRAAGANQTAQVNNYYYNCDFSNRQYAPYAKKLALAIKNGFLPRDIFIFIGDYAWKKAKGLSDFQATVVFPNDSATPDNYNWHFVKGFSVLLYDTSNVGAEIIRWLSYEILKSGAKLIAFVSVNFIVSFFKQNGGVHE
jgi:hypothetical protein